MDAGQENGEIAVKSDRGRPPKEVTRTAGDLPKAVTFTDLGVTSQRVAEARTIRDAYTDTQIDDIIQDANASDVCVARVDFVKKKAHVGESTGEQEWYTPPGILAAARGVFLVDSFNDNEEGERSSLIGLDPASSVLANATVGAQVFYTATDDGLSKVWNAQSVAPKSGLRTSGNHQ